MSFPRYGSYEESGIDWLGEIPSHWNVCSLKRLCDTITDGAHVSPETEDGAFCFVSTKDLIRQDIDFDGCLRTSKASYEYLVRTGCRPHVGDVLFSKDGTIGRTVVVNEERDFVGASSLIIIRPDKKRLNSNYLHLLCQSNFVCSQVESFVKGAGLPRLSIQNLLRVVGLFPPVAEQFAIAAFLDRETAKIDALVKEQQRLIELLEEKRQAVISHAVTKGLDPNGPMKNSGVQWLGEVPKHWAVSVIKRCLKSADYGISDALEPDGSIAVLRMGNIKDGEVVLDDLKFVSEVNPILLLEQDDLLYNRTNSLDLIGKVGRFVPAGDNPVTFASYLVRLRANERCVPAFLAYALNTNGILGAARSRAFVAIGQCNLNPTRYGELELAVPPRSEQETIVSFLDTEIGRIKGLQDNVEAAIVLLQERRAALISAAVTGKIDVRGLGEVDAPIPDVVAA